MQKLMNIFTQQFSISDGIVSLKKVKKGRKEFIDKDAPHRVKIASYAFLLYFKQRFGSGSTRIHCM